MKDDLRLLNSNILSFNFGLWSQIYSFMCVLNNLAMKANAAAGPKCTIENYLLNITQTVFFCYFEQNVEFDK